MKLFDKFKLLFIGAMCAIGLSSCDKSHTVNYNLDRQANSFELYRQFSLVNLRSDTVLMEVEGLIAISNSVTDGATNELTITIKTGANTYKKHYCYIGGEVCYLIEQKENATTDPYHWEIRLYWMLPDFILG